MKVAQNTIELIRMMVRSKEDISVSEAARQIGVNRSTASRLLATLRDGGLFDQNPDTQKYRPGMLALQLGMRSRSSFNVLEWITAQAETVVQAIGHTVCLGVLDGADVMIVATKRRATPIYLTLDVGTCIRAHASAMGKVILAQLDDEAVRALLPEPLDKMAEMTRISHHALLEDLALIRKTGYAISHNELANGISSYAVCTRLKDETPMAIGVAYLSNENHSDEYQIVSSLLDFKKRIDRELLLVDKPVRR